VVIEFEYFMNILICCDQVVNKIVSRNASSLFYLLLRFITLAILGGYFRVF